MDQLMSSQPLEDSSTGHDPCVVRAPLPLERLEHVVVRSPRLTLTPEQLHELTGYKRGAEQARRLKENGFKYRLDRLGRPRVDRAHYETKRRRWAASPRPGSTSTVARQTGPHWLEHEACKRKSRSSRTCTRCRVRASLPTSHASTASARTSATTWRWQGPSSQKTMRTVYDRRKTIKVTPLA